MGTRAASGEIVINSATGKTSKGGAFTQHAHAVTTTPPPPRFEDVTSDEDAGKVAITYGPAPERGSRVMASDVVRVGDIPESYWQGVSASTPQEWEDWVLDAQEHGQYHEPTDTILLPGAGKTDRKSVV